MADSKLTSPLTLEDIVLWFGSIELYPDKIVISGWSWTGKTEQEIPIQNISTFEKWTNRKGPNFRIRINGEDSVYGRMEEGAELWALEMEEDERLELKRRH